MYCQVWEQLLCYYRYCMRFIKCDPFMSIKYIHYFKTFSNFENIIFIELNVISKQHICKKKNSNYVLYIFNFHYCYNIF